MTETKTRITYRRTKSGDWVAFGPAAAVLPRRHIHIHKKDGDTELRFVERVGRTFTVDGVEMVYGYLEARGARRSAGCPWWDSPRERAMARRGGELD